MRTYLILAAAAIITTALAYGILDDDVISNAPQTASLQSSAMPDYNIDIQSKLNRLTDELQHNNQTFQEQLQQTKQEQVRLHNLLVDLNARMQSAENLGDENNKIIANASGEDNSQDLAESATNTTMTSTPTEISEIRFSQWVDESFNIGYVDEALTAQAETQAVNSLANSPDVNLENMQCSDRICRATFDEKDEATIMNHIGEPPFVSEGFTIKDVDGHVHLYFTQPGVSLAELRDDMR